MTALRELKPSEPDGGSHTSAKGDVTNEVRAVHMHLVRHKHEWRRALYRTALPASCYRVGLYLCDECANSVSGKLHPKIDTIALELGMARGTVKDGLARLKSAGLLHAKKPRGNAPPDYFLASPALAGYPADEMEDELLDIQPPNGRKSSRSMAENPADSTMEDNHGRSTMEFGASAGDDAAYGGPAALPPYRSEDVACSRQSGGQFEDIFEERRRLL